MISAECKKINHYEEVCRSGRNKRVYHIDPHVEQYQDEDETDKVNINSFYIGYITLNGKLSVIRANWNTSSRQTASVITHKIDSGSDENIMPFHILQ